MRKGKWRIAIEMLCSGVLILSTSACDRAYRPTDRGDAELKAEDDAARRAARNQAAHILVKVDDDNVDQRLTRLEQDVEILKASLNKEQTDLELLRQRVHCRRHLAVTVHQRARGSPSGFPSPSVPTKQDRLDTSVREEAHLCLPWHV